MRTEIFLVSLLARLDARDVFEKYSSREVCAIVFYLFYYVFLHSDAVTLSERWSPCYATFSFRSVFAYRVPNSEVGLKWNYII